MPDNPQKNNRIAELLKSRQKEILKIWQEKIRSQSDQRLFELITEQQLKRETSKLLQALIMAFASGDFEDIERKEFSKTLSLLREISQSHAAAGCSPSETAIYVFSLKNALLEFLQDEFGRNPSLLNNQIIQINNLMDKLGLFTFESYSRIREQLIEEQSRSLLELSTPVVQLWDDIVLMPLIGVIDTHRAQHIMETLLAGIVDYQAQVVILDITGVPVIDTRVAQHLIKTISAAKMLGTEVIITGISTESAQTLAKLGIDLSNINTRGSLRGGVAAAFAFIDAQLPNKKEGMK
ncbi:MAG: STAS domain-containing protein [bacterium]